MGRLFVLFDDISENFHDGRKLGVGDEEEENSKGDRFKQFGLSSGDVHIDFDVLAFAVFDDNADCWFFRGFVVRKSK